jgi:hypothetical protein
MLRTYFVQQWFNLPDPGVEEALYDSAALRRFVGVDLGRAPAPDQTSVCRFRHLLESPSSRICALNHHDYGTRQLSGKEESTERWNNKTHLGWKTGDSVDG